MSGELVSFEDVRGNAITLTADLVRRHLSPMATNEELYQFLMLCQHQRLNPWLREAYLIKYDKNRPATMVVGKDVFLQRAEKHPKFDGYQVEVYDADDKPYRARQGQTIAYATATVFRKDRKVPTVVTVLFKEYNTAMSGWAKMPVTMLRKTALEQALRETFTQEFVGMYGPEEMGIDPTEMPDNVIDVTNLAVEEPDDEEIDEDMPAEIETATRADEVAGGRPEPETSDPVPAVAMFEVPGNARAVPVSPFAVVTALAQLYGGAWSRATVKVNGALVTVAERYFGVPLGSANDMAAFALANPAVWDKGSRAVMTAAKTKAKKG